MRSRSWRSAGLGERLVELGLAEQHDLQQLVAVRLQVRQQPHLLERVLGHDVRLVDQDHHAAPGAVERDQVLLQLAQRHAAPLGRELELEVVADRVQDLVARERGRGEVDGRDVLRQPLHQHAAQHGLAAADLARHLDDAFVVQHRVDQRLQRRAAVGAVEEEIGVRRDAERRLGEAEMLEVERHAISPRPLSHAAVERRAVDSEQLRGLRDVAARQAQRGLDVGALPGLERLVEVERARRARAGAAPATVMPFWSLISSSTSNSGFQLRGRNALAGVLGAKPDDDVAQLAHVAGEAVAQPARGGALVEFKGNDTPLARRVLLKMIQQQRACPARARAAAARSA